MRCSRCRLGELRRELAERVVLAALLDQAEGGDIPERGGSTVAQHDLPALRKREQLGQPRTNGADEVLDRSLAVRATEQVAVGPRQRQCLLRPDLRRSASE